MKQIQRFRSIAWVVLLAMALAGCTREEPTQHAQNAYEQVRKNFSSQQAFAFYGRTKLVTGQTANGNVVNFSGQKQGDDIYLNVKLSAPERKRIETLSLLARREQLFAQDGNQGNWVPVNQQDVALQQEFNNWNPVFTFKQVDQMKKEIVPIEDRRPDDELEAVRVLLDSDKLKTWLAKQLKQQARSQALSTHALAAHTPRHKWALSLSDDDWKRFAQGARVQAAETNGDIDQLIDRMELEAECTIYYNRDTMLPSSTVMTIRSAYDLHNQRIQEHTQVETFLQNYGRYFQTSPANGATR
ncbi:hypothetical protein [Brevibacillus fulvus]|uniref:Lipoprotein n=1 Tax=Brevibacillus fulvus TaxID=1125967 RepID=A0A938XZV4_9BACL|nr:hypothetical protein [Brevibacillus fulvus]MBM7590801.1 hypothetical protein [Brevibacillus fulvus]